MYHYDTTRVVVVHSSLQPRLIRHGWGASFFDVGASLKNCSRCLQRTKPCGSFGPKANKLIAGGSSPTNVVMGNPLLFNQLKTQSYRSLSSDCLTKLFFFSFFTTFSKWQFFKGKDLTYVCYLNLNQVIIKKKILNQDTNNCHTLFFNEY